MNLGTTSQAPVQKILVTKPLMDSLDKGPNIAGAFGYNFSSYLAGELGIVYKLSNGI